MAAQVVTITSGKGGVGKTTAVANLAVALAADGGKVVCIDGDIGLRNLDVVMGLENRIVYDLVDVIEGRCRLRQAMIRDKRLPELFLIPAAQTRDKSAVSPSDLLIDPSGDCAASRYDNAAVALAEAGHRLVEPVLVHIADLGVVRRSQQPQLGREGRDEEGQD